MSRSESAPDRTPRAARGWSRKALEAQRLAGRLAAPLWLPLVVAADALRPPLADPRRGTLPEGVREAPRGAPPAPRRGQPPDDGRLGGDRLGARVGDRPRRAPPGAAVERAPAAPRRELVAVADARLRDEVRPRAARRRPPGGGARARAPGPPAALRRDGADVPGERSQPLGPGRPGGDRGRGGPPDQGGRRLPRALRLPARATRSAPGRTSRPGGHVHDRDAPRRAAHRAARPPRLARPRHPGRPPPRRDGAGSLRGPSAS